MQAQASNRDLLPIHERLWREDRDGVEEEALRLWEARLDAAEFLSSDRLGRHGFQAEVYRRLRRPLPMRPEKGLTLAEIAANAGMDRETLARLMIEHGYLELVPFNGTQRRRLVTDEAFKAGVGHNVDGSTIRIGRLEGMNRACVFPVFYERWIDRILWTLDLDRIKATASEMPKKQCLEWLMVNHAYFPDAELARLSGYSLRLVKMRRKQPV